MMNPFSLSFLIMLAFVLAELLILKWVRKTPVPWKDVIFNLNSGHILMWVFRGVEVAAFALLLRHVNLHIVDQWPVAAQWVFAFFAWDLCFYWMHRLHHKSPCCGPCTWCTTRANISTCRWACAIPGIRR